MTAISEIFAKRQQPVQKDAPVGSKTARQPAATTAIRLSGRPGPKLAENRSSRVPDWLDAVVSEFSIELHDQKSRRSNITQALRLWQGSGRSDEEFRGLLFEAHRVTRSKLRSIRKRASDHLGDLGVKNGMPYLFTVLRGLLGVDQDGKERFRR